MNKGGLPPPLSSSETLCFPIRSHGSHRRRYYLYKLVSVSTGQVWKMKCHVNPQALVPVAEGHEFEYKEKSERITMSELVVKGCVDKSVNPVHELESQYGDFKQIQDDLDEDSIEVFCHLATLNKGAKQKAHDMARHLNNLAKHTEKMRSTFMDASIAEVENNELRKSENLFVIQRLTKENSEIDTINKKINPFIDKMRKSMT